MLRYAQVTVDGQMISYATEGSGPPLLLLHGLPFDHRNWAATIPYLAGHFRVIAPDLPGCGRSRAATNDGTPDTLLRMIAGFMTATQSVPAFVAGTGFGGGVALGLAVRYPERVRALIGVGALGLQEWPGTFLASLARSARLFPGLLWLGMRLLPRPLARWFLGSALQQQTSITNDLVSQVDAVMRDPQGREALIRVLRNLEQWRFVMRQLGGVRAPVLLIWGERDAVYGLPAAERLRHAIPGAQLITIAGSGHALTIERPAEVGAAIRTFLGASTRQR